jgi:Methyltransferase domain
MKSVLARMRRAGGIAAASVFKVDAIREFVIKSIAANISENYPVLEARHLDNPRLFAHREDLISSFRFLEGGVIAEIGVADGCFSEFLLSQLRPKKLVAFDIFTMHEFTTEFAGRTDVFSNMTQLEHYRRKFADCASQVVIEVGMSQQNLAKYPNKSFDLIYIDGDHSYAGVKQDTNLAKIKLADDGIIVFNDYILYDYVNGVTYGVVRAVNELIVNEDWRVCGFSLNWGMFCDIAVRRPSVPSL